ncbi:hypothetical protein YC2023_102575 [Brassica napus]
MTCLDDLLVSLPDDLLRYNLPVAEFNETPLRECALGFPLRSYIEEAAVRTVVRTTVITAER